MKATHIVLLFALAGCGTNSQQMYESSSPSSARAKEDGVFLKSYRLNPATPYLPVKEAFVEQRFLVGGYPERLRLLDSTRIEANLIIICTRPINLGSLSFDWNLMLADGGPWTDQQARVPCSEQTPELLRFRLKERPTFDNPTFPMRLQLLKMKDTTISITKTIDLVATPL